jgi:hypothetical protein
MVTGHRRCGPRSESVYPILDLDRCREMNELRGVPSCRWDGAAASRARPHGAPHRRDPQHDCTAPITADPGAAFLNLKARPAKGLSTRKGMAATGTGTSKHPSTHTAIPLSVNRTLVRVPPRPVAARRSSRIPLRCRSTTSCARTRQGSWPPAPEQVIEAQSAHRLPDRLRPDGRRVADVRFAPGLRQSPARAGRPRAGLP